MSGTSTTQGRPESVTQDQVAIRQLETPWMTAAEAATYFRLSIERLRRAGREYEKSNGRKGLKVCRPTRHSTFHLHHDDVVNWLQGNPPTRGTRKFASL